MNLLQLLLYFICKIIIYNPESQEFFFLNNAINSKPNKYDNSNIQCKQSNRINFQHIKNNILFKEQLLFPAFMDSIITNFNLIFENWTYLDYLHFCQQNNLDSCYTENVNKFVTLNMLHKLVTCKSAENGSVGAIWKIPYFWHYVEPNPRHKIKLISNGKKLSETKPPKEFSRYQSYADIDRTPYLYWSDFLTETPKYETADQGKFYSFGWCSEREMAFVSLLRILNFNANIITMGNHSTTEVFTYFIGLEKQSILFKVNVDNTFDRIDWVELEPDKKMNPSPNDWYNRKAKSRTELNRLRNLLISPKCSNRVSMQIEKYFNSY